MTRSEVQKILHIFYMLFTRTTLLGTNISPPKACLKNAFLFPRWDMLIPWRVSYPNPTKTTQQEPAIFFIPNHLPDSGTPLWKGLIIFQTQEDPNCFSTPRRAELLAWQLKCWAVPWWKKKRVDTPLMLMLKVFLFSGITVNGQLKMIANWQLNASVVENCKMIARPHFFPLDEWRVMSYVKAFS